MQGSKFLDGEMLSPVVLPICKDPAPRCQGGGVPAWVPTVAGVKADYHADFANSRYLALGTVYPTFADWLTAVGGSFTRSTIAWDKNGVSYAVNAPRMDAAGLVTEEARTNYLANPTAFVTQTVSLAAGNYCLFLKGAGSVALSGGPTGTATEGSPVTFTLASTTSVTFTASGALTWVNCQNQQYPTTPILATTAPTTRQADVATFTPVLAAAYSVLVTGTVAQGTDNANGNSNQSLFQLTGTNSLNLTRDRLSQGLQLGVNDGSASTVTIQAIENASYLKVAVRAKANDFAIVGNGMTFNIQKITARGMPVVTTARIGRGNGSQGWNGTVATLTIFPVALSDSDLIIQSTTPGALVSRGDSLTAGAAATSFTKAYPYVLGNLFTPKRSIYNEGVSGTTSSQILARMVADPTYNDRINIIWAGRNNYASPSQVLSDIASMVSRVTSGKYVVMTVLNSAYDGEWSGQSNYLLIKQINDAIMATYPNNYVDIRSILVNAFSAGNPVDVIDKSHDVPPYSLRGFLASGTLSANVGASDTTFTTSIPVSAGAELFIGSEYIRVISASGNTVTSCTRGYAGTTPAAYTSGAAFTQKDPLHLGDPGYDLAAQSLFPFIIGKGW